MDTMYRCCAGLDVHKETVAACVRRVDSAGRVAREVRTFGTMTGELLKLSDWLIAEGVEAAAMESTGVFWKPIWNILEGSLQLILVNARIMSCPDTPRMSVATEPSLTLASSSVL